MTDKLANLRDARSKVISLRRQRPDLRIQATDLIRCIENKLKAPDDPQLVEAFKRLAVPLLGSINRDNVIPLMGKGFVSHRVEFGK